MQAVDIRNTHHPAESIAANGLLHILRMSVLTGNCDLGATAIRPLLSSKARISHIIDSGFYEEIADLGFEVLDAADHDGKAGFDNDYCFIWSRIALNAERRFSDRFREDLLSKLFRRYQRLSKLPVAYEAYSNFLTKNPSASASLVCKQSEIALLIANAREKGSRAEKWKRRALESASEAFRRDNSSVSIVSNYISLLSMSGKKAHLSTAQDVFAKFLKSLENRSVGIILQEPDGDYGPLNLIAHVMRYSLPKSNLSSVNVFRKMLDIEARKQPDYSHTLKARGHFQAKFDPIALRLWELLLPIAKSRIQELGNNVNDDDDDDVAKRSMSEQKTMVESNSQDVDVRVEKNTSDASTTTTTTTTTGNESMVMEKSKKKKKNRKRNVSLAPSAKHDPSKKKSRRK